MMTYHLVIESQYFSSLHFLLTVLAMLDALDHDVEALVFFLLLPVLDGCLEEMEK
jgi:hypothetical protein